MSAAEANEDLRALQDLDRQRTSSRQQLLSLRGTLQMKQKIKKRSELCLKEIETLPDTTVAYKAVGRMFLLTPLPVVRTELNALIQRSIDDSAALESQQKYIIQNIDSAEKAIAETMGKQQQQQAA